MDVSPDAIAYWRDNPIEFVKHCFKVTPDDWQAECLKTYAKPGRKRIGRKSCAGPGKSCEMAWEIHHFTTCYGDAQDHPQGAVVSINRDNLRDGLWKEVAKWQRISDLHRNAFRWTSEKYFLRAHPETWFVSARAWPKTADPEEQGNTLSGIHSKYVGFWIDEAGSIPNRVKQAAEQAFAQVDIVFAVISIAGNPTDKNGMLYRATASDSHLWDLLISITGDPEDPHRSPRVDIDHCRLMIQTYGRSSPWVKVFILGEFPDDAINQLLSLSEVEEAQRRAPKPGDYDWAPMLLGIDVAREGLDATVFARRQGQMVFPFHEMHILDTQQIAAQAALQIEQYGVKATFVDNTGGYGGGVIDHLRTPLGYSPIPVGYAESADDRQFKNRRTHNWWKMAQGIKNQGWALPDNAFLRADLITPTYTYMGDQMLLEPKKLIKIRLDGRSPDYGDSLSQTCDTNVAEPNRPAATVLDAKLRRMGKVRGRRMSAHDNPWADED
jgi:hypothetical protein